MMKLFSMFGVLALAVGCFAADQGTKDDPLTISSVQELLQFRNAVLDSGMYKGVKLENGGEGLHFKLTADLDLSTVCGRDVGNWKPIGPFEGSFDGANHKISNLYMDDSLGRVGNPGFFGPVFNNGDDTLYFNNVVFENVYIRTSGIVGTFVSQVVTGKAVLRNNKVDLKFESTKDETADLQLGGLMGNTVGDWVGFYDNTVKGSIKVSSLKQVSIGGIIGILVDPGALERNVNEASITVDGNSYTQVGGLIGQLIAPYTMKDNVNKGDISVNVPAQYAFVGGLVGVNPSLPSEKNVVGNVNYGKIEVAASYAGVGGLYGLISGNTNSVLDSCINNGDVIYHGVEIQQNVQVGGIAGIWEVKQASRMENNGKIVIENALSPNVGGIVGYVRPGAKSMDLFKSVNAGDISVNNQTVNKGWVSGLVGFTDEIEYVNLDSCVNKGNIVFEGAIDSTSLFVVAFASAAPGTNINFKTSTNDGTVPENLGGRTSLKVFARAPKMHLQRLGYGRAILEVPDLESTGREQVELFSYNGRRVPVQQMQSGNLFYLEGVPAGRYVVRVKTSRGLRSLRVTF
ncbi:hypothetical protein [Fibrobacter sp. UWB11]|uniref:hypothetical protein n=1 Tax=Fibrobacter sp. UWB11 TaxID=1896202 RepID=UPI0015880B78|nr:hypothetical protein [Fibrobacter sp. UWB11]